MIGWVAAKDIRPGARMRLFCLPHAGSGATAYYRWKRELAGVDVCPVMLPGRELRLAEACREDCKALAADLLEATKGMLDVPYAIFGHSMGALIAYEWAQAIKAAGLRAPVCMFFSGRIAAHLPYGLEEVHGLSDEEFVEQLGQRYGGIPEDFLAAPELREVFLPILRADLKLVETYQFVDGGRLECPVVGLTGVEDASVSEDGIRGWGELTAGGFVMKKMRGGHFYHFAEGEKELLMILRGRLG